MEKIACMTYKPALRILKYCLSGRHIKCKTALKLKRMKYRLMDYQQTSSETLELFLKYIPVNLAVNTHEPVNGADETLSPIIFLHGFGGSKELWADIPQDIANRTKRKCYAYDARDHGDSQWTEHFSFGILIDDLLYFMDSKNIKKAILIGHSMGGWTAAWLALKKPERIELLILEDAYASEVTWEIIEESMKFMVTWQKALKTVPRGLDESEVIRLAVDCVYAQIPQQYEKYFTKKEYLYNSKAPIKRLEDGSYDVKHNMKLFEAMGVNIKADCHKPEGTYDGPTCVIYAKYSLIQVQEKEEEIRRHFPNTEMILFEGATHNVHIDFPEKFTDTVMNFLTKHLGSSRRYSF